MCVFLRLVLQNELARVMRSGIDQIIEFDKRPEDKTRVYTYENAVKRFSTVLYIIQGVTISFLNSIYIK